MVKTLLLLSWGEDKNGQRVDLFLPCASNPPWLIQIISHPRFKVLFSLPASPFHVIISSLKYLQAFENPTWCLFTCLNHVENIALSLFTSVKDDNTFLPLMEEFCTVGGTWAAPVKTSIRLKTDQTRICLLGLLLARSAVLGGWVSSPVWWEAPAFAAQSCCGGVYISLTLRRSSNFTVQQRWCNFRLLPKGSSCVFPSPSSCGFVSEHWPSCAPAATWSSLPPDGCFSSAPLCTPTAACHVSTYLHRGYRQ